GESNPIQNSVVRAEEEDTNLSQSLRDANSDGIGLEVVLPVGDGQNVGNFAPTSVSVATMGDRRRSGVVDLVDNSRHT
ncbi:hypothetical protein A2U01_0096684, partial [Trifolium medium]|nr:hypothetical protein [Trifolium medium]